MNSLLFDNLLSWSAQVAILTIAAGAAAYALRHARARLYFWQAILLVVIVLPAIAPWKTPVTVALPPSVSISVATQGAVQPVIASTSWGFEQLLVLLAAGAVFRLAWVGLGLIRLSRIRKHAQRLQDPPVAFSGDARWYVSDQVSGPVTFGWLQPTILLPAKVRELTPSAQEAIACHELFHVHRRDWLFVMAEELIRSVLWFHPAVWFVLSRVQLAREQVVDQQVVDATRDRAGYLDALVSVAAQRFRADVAPAPLFLKRRQLAVRVQTLLKETSMSASRLTAHVSVAAFVAILGVCTAVWLFPLRSAAQVAPDDPGITVDAGAPLSHRPPVRHPGGTDATGDVLLELTVNSKGEVADARVLAGPDELRKSALTNVLQWHYAADTAPPSVVRATIHFGQRRPGDVAPPPPPPPPPPGIGGGIGGGRSGGIGNGIGAGIGPGLVPPPPPPPPPPPENWVVQKIVLSGLSPELQQRVQGRLTVREGDTLDRDGQGRLRQDLQQIDEHLSLSISIASGYDSQRANVVLRIALRSDALSPMVTARVSGLGEGISAPVPTYRVEPEYSEEARAAKWQGPVLLQLVIDENGVPQTIQVVRPLGLGLDQKAIEAVQKWRFKPGLKDGTPVPVVANIEVNFRLQQSPEPIAAVSPGSRPVMVGGGVMESRVVQKVPPLYPDNARIARVQGNVQLGVTIGPDGRVQNVQPISGPALLTQSAVEAVSQWIYQPFLLNGQPIPVQTTTNVNFVLR